MQRSVREISVFVQSAIFLLFGPLSVARGDSFWLELNRRYAK
jgi:hypothetical protein